MDAVQEVIHRLEVGGGMRYLRVALAALAVLVLAAAYDWRGYRNFSTEEAMDSAQLARNIAQGKGYTTLFIRPLSLYLLKQNFQPGAPATNNLASNPDLAQIRGNHPDLANPPVYPVLLAGLMKVLPFHWAISDKPASFWTINGQFARYQPDFLIALFNQALLLLLVGLVFLLARRLYDRTVAWLSALLLLGTELMWRFSVSGLSTMLLLVLFVGLVWCVVLLDEEIHEPRWGIGALFGLAALGGLVVGIGALTRYSFGWLLAPLLLYVALFTGRQRVALMLTAAVAFFFVLSPWVVRNYRVCGQPFGVATFAAAETTYLYPEHKLERSIEPNLMQQPGVRGYMTKLLGNSRKIIENDLPRLGGTWLSAFFLVSLLVGTRTPTGSRLKVFLVAAILMLAMVQALGRTQLSEDSPDINSENFLVLLTPGLIIYGVGLFYLVLEQLELPFHELRYVVLGSFCVVACLPLILTFLPPYRTPISYPPYYPPLIQKDAMDWTTPDELVMSDIPWAVAWYGQRQSVWLTLNCQEDFHAINDWEKPVRELYLSSVTLDAPFQSHWGLESSSNDSWGKFVLGLFGFQNGGKPTMPGDFPTWKGQHGWPNQLVLTYRVRSLREQP